MRVIEIQRHGGPEVLALAERPAPAPGPGQIVARVDAAGVNYADIYGREGIGGYARPTPFVTGGEGAGPVIAVGPGVTQPAVGDLVAWSGPASYAEQVALPADRAVPVPAGMSAEVAAAALLQGMTAHYLAISTYPVRQGDVTVVHAAAGGVGLLLTRGMLVVYGAASGQVPPFDLQRLNSGGSLFVTRPTLAHYSADVAELHWRAGEVLDWVARGELDVRIGGRYPLADAARAQQDLASRGTTGKLLLIP